MASIIRWHSRWRTSTSPSRSSRETGGLLKAHVFRAMPIWCIKCFPKIPREKCFLASIVIVAWAMLFGEIGVLSDA